jgi:hypothetical protein
MVYKMNAHICQHMSNKQIPISESRILVIVISTVFKPRIQCFIFEYVVLYAEEYTQDIKLHTPCPCVMRT